ncbi:uncharacterized protein BX663DRAFT_500745 [Cokeromyces recurvatus]|uniref:uncharacterized protein n=1 Tax=Cokeromyces recurvatus TaxID=90255 RepID=UPI00221FFAC6|nr:uncharacterized protein BX663DRAFT_500745 [Cokeromyces recurvatus]KAI7905740.1 hypothetical protein BX663DRAFT_500745 [Cokeromyces recurvatus]
MYETKIEDTSKKLDNNESTTLSQQPTTENQPSSVSVLSTTDDEDYRDEPIYIDDGIPSEIPLEALAGPALILPANDLLPNNTDLDGRTLNEEFDWEGKDDDEEEDDEKKENSTSSRRNTLARSGVIICLNQNASHIAWACIILFALIFIAIDVAVFVVYRHRVNITSYGLQLWFTWITFMWCIGFMSQIFVELVPWAIKKGVGFFGSQSTEVLRMRLSYYMALRVYIKLFIISAWAWGSWAFIKDRIALPLNGKLQYEAQPKYAGVFYSVWEAVFFATLFLFIEKFILQLIVTFFYRKAYEDRIKENDRALHILDKLKKVKRKNPQEFLLKRIRRNKNKTSSNNNTPNGTTTTTRTHSLDETNSNDQHYFNYQPPSRTTATKSIIAMDGNQQPNKSNVKFPTHNMDTLIAIPPLEDRHPRSDDEKQDYHCQENVNTTDKPNDIIHKKKKKKFFNKLTSRVKKIEMHDNSSSSGSDFISSTSSTPSPITISRENMCHSRKSQEEKGFLGGANALKGKLFKDSYHKFITQANYNHNNSGSNNNHNNNNATNSIQQAKYLAKKIYNNLMGPDNNRDTIVEADFYPFFKTTKEASYAFSLFDADGNGDISKRELRAGCVRIYRERKNLSRSMRDLSQATGKLDIILMIIFTVVWVIIVCAAFGVNVGTDLMPLWSAFVAASFIFGTSAKDAFESIIFVFVTHPFDSGDRVMIQNENWVVQNVGLLVTTFVKWDGSIVYAKNSTLSTQYIINIRRSGRTGETIDLQVSFSTPSWKIKQLTEHMVQWCNQYPKLYTTNATSTNIVSYPNENTISLSFYFEHIQNWQDSGGRWLRHNNFMYELKEECERLEINYTAPSEPSSEANSSGNKPNDAPPEVYNMGSKAGHGLEGIKTRRPYELEDEYGYRNQPIGGDSSNNPSTPLSSGNNQAESENVGAVAGAASALIFGTEF